jgi:hypothetical protein
MVLPGTKEPKTYTMVKGKYLSFGPTMVSSKNILILQEDDPMNMIPPAMVKEEMVRDVSSRYPSPTSTEGYSESVSEVIDLTDDEVEYHSWGRSTPGGHPSTSTSTPTEEAKMTLHATQMRRHSGSACSYIPGSPQYTPDSPRSVPPSTSPIEQMRQQDEEDRCTPRHLTVTTPPPDKPKRLSLVRCGNLQAASKSPKRVYVTPSTSPKPSTSSFVFPFQTPTSPGQKSATPQRSDSSPFKVPAAVTKKRVGTKQMMRPVTGPVPTINRPVPTRPAVQPQVRPCTVRLTRCQPPVTASLIVPVRAEVFPSTSGNNATATVSSTSQGWHFHPTIGPQDFAPEDMV